MSGFHPILGLLAVAVCISSAEVAAFPSIAKDTSNGDKLGESNSERYQITRKHNAARGRSLKMNGKQASLNEDKDQQSAVKNAAFSERASDLVEVGNLRTAGEDAIRRQAADESGASGSIQDQSTQDGGLMSKYASNPEEESESSLSEDSEADNQASQSEDTSFRSVVPTSGESCEDDEEAEPSTKDTSKVPTHSATSPPTEQTSDSETPPATSTDEPEEGSQEDCEGATENPGEASSQPPNSGMSQSQESNSELSNSESNESEQPGSGECEDTEEPRTPVTSPTTARTARTAHTARTTASPRKPPRKPQDGSSGDFDDTDESGVQFSDSKSDESFGDSTDLSKW